MASEDIKLKCFDTVHSWSRLIVTLATGGILFTAIFKEHFSASGKALSCTEALFVAWIALGLAAVLGVLVVGALVAKLNSGNESSLDVYSGAVRYLAVLQSVLFLSGLGLLLIFAQANLA